MNELKEQLHDLCTHYINKNIDDIEAAIADRRIAIAAETKSSMGDKYETTREMLQQEINMNLRRLGEAQAGLAVLNAIDPGMSTDVVTAGSLVVTVTGGYYISVSAGSHVIDGKKYYAVSASSPVGKLLLGKKKGDAITLNNNRITIISVQ
ncbi:MAG: hypothetical protein KDC07_06755 [Chitinophagaceae bacterium]|nr:hypothetical protein [Chitinophagaceae bacterium]MCB9045174.1 3-oxoacyl-ACP synthase [Chitinophagales bacterium]